MSLELTGLRFRVTGTEKWRKVKREAKLAGPAAKVQSPRGSAIAEHHRSASRQSFEVRHTDPMVLDDAVAWQACLDGDATLLREALQRDADPNFRGPTYSCGTLLHVACAGGRMDCARLLLEDFAADDRAKDRKGKVPFAYLTDQSDLKYMQQLLEDVVSRRNCIQRDKQTKEDVIFRARLAAEGGDVLKGWVIHFVQEAKETNAIVVGYHDGPAVLTGRRTKELDLALWNQSNVLALADQCVKFDDDLHFTLVRRATAAELTAAGVETKTGFAAHVKPISVRVSGVDRSAEQFTNYSFDVMIGDECVHSISDRYSNLEKDYGGKKSIFAQYGTFPPKTNKVRLTDSARATAEGKRKELLKKFFEDILDVHGEKEMSVEQRQEVHRKLRISDAASQRLIGIPESLPGLAAPLESSHETQQKNYTDWGVITQLQTRALEAKVSSDLRRAHTVAEFAEVDLAQSSIAAVKEMESKLLSMETKRHEASRTCAFYECHLSASVALRKAKDCMRQEDYESAIVELRSGLKSTQLANHLRSHPGDARMSNRWDLELWLKVAKMRKYLADGEIWRAVQQLERHRNHPSMCWSLDVTGGTGLYNAVEDCFSEMGVTPGEGRGQLVDKREALKSDIATMVNATQHQVDQINTVLNHLNSEVLRLATLPEAMYDQEPEPELEPDVHAIVRNSSNRQPAITSSQIEEMRSRYEKYWPAGQDSITVQLLGDIMETIPGHDRPTALELQNVIDGFSSEQAHECRVDTSQYLDICSQQLDDADRELLEVFQTFDADGDGKITAVELREVMKHYSQAGTHKALNLSDSVVDEMMREGDTNGSGDINWAEFKQMIKRNTVDCSALDRTMDLVMKQWTGAELEHHNLGPVLQATTQAIKAMSRMCGYASFAAKASLTECVQPETPPIVSINSTCSGTELWCLTVVRQIICEHERDPDRNTNPTVSFALPGKIICLPGECNVNAALEHLLSSVEDRMDELTKDLERRNAVRVNTAAGETARVSRNVGEALRHLKRAYEHATESEKAELQTHLDICSVELKRQQTVKGLHADAISALAQGNGARTAIARCAAALRSETHESTTEYDAINHMQQLAQAWDKGDVALAQWQGIMSLKHYETAKSHHEYIEGLIPTEGYYGGMIRLGDRALQELQRCMGKAQREIDRKQNYGEIMRLAETHLDEYRASDAEKKFCEALGVAEGEATIPQSQQDDGTALERLRGPESESINAKDGISRAQEELARQVAAKELFGQAIAAVESCIPTKEWNHKPEDDFIELWHEQSESVELAIGRCTEALQSVLSQEGRLKSQQRTPERRSLDKLIEAFNAWKSGGECMANRQCHEALDQFQSASKASEDAAQCIPTAGYHGAQIKLSDDAQQVLQACIDSANTEIARQREKGAIDEARRRQLGGGAANEAVQQAKKERELARTAAEIEEADQKIQEAEKNLKRQEGVKELHKKATDALKQNDPDTALGLYSQALVLAVPDAAAGLSEPQSLEHMKQVSQLWIEGKAALQRWDGAAAIGKFKQCRKIEQDLNKIVPTTGYAGSMIKLGLATAELSRCEAYAQAEVERNSEFELLIKAGRQALVAWQAEHAIQCFTEADDHKHAQFVLKYVVAKKSVVRPENAAERETVRLCIEQATAELTRQKQVKTAFKECVRHLEMNTHACELSFNVSPAIQRCAAQATLAAAKSCQQAIEYCLCNEGSLRSQSNIPEHNALEEVKRLVEAWKLGDERLAAWDGKGALTAYQTADAHARSAVDIMKRPTEGYLDSTSVKVELTTPAADALQRCITEAKDEIARKERFDEHVRAGQEHLSNLQAAKAHQRFSQADEEKMNAQESRQVDELLRQTCEENERQSKVKECFCRARQLLCSSRACDDLVQRRVPEQHKQLQKELKILHEDVKRSLDSAFQHVCSTEGRLLKSHEGEPEDDALKHMKACFDSWKSADELLVARNGIEAHAAYTRALECANLAKDVEPTPGYAGEKIELDEPTQDFLTDCIRIASLEVVRKNDFNSTIRQGDQQLRYDRAAFHLSMDPVQSYSSSEMITRSRCEAEGCPEPDIAHAGKCDRCVCCHEQFCPAISTVHTVNSSIIYTIALAKAMTDCERDTTMGQITGCVEKLEESLQAERVAYTELAKRASVHFDEHAALAFLFDKDFATPRTVNSKTRGPESTLSALRSLAVWRRDADSGVEHDRITAEHIRSKLDDAITAIAEMHASNDQIRSLEKQKITESPAPAGAPAGGLETLGEEDEEGSDEECIRLGAPAALPKPESPLEEIEQLRDIQRETAIQRGRDYEAAATELLEQKKGVEKLSRDLRLGVLGLQRLWRSHCFTGDRNQLMRSWLVAGASESWTIEKESLTDPQLRSQAQIKVGSLKLQTARKDGWVFGSQKIVLFEAEASLDGGRLTVTTKPTADDKKNYKESEEVQIVQFMPNSTVESITDSTAETRSKAIGEVKGKVNIKHAFRVDGSVDGSDRSIILIANDEEERAEWCRKITRKIDLIKAGAQLALADPVPEEVPPEVTVESACLSRSQKLANQAIDRWENWRASVDHSAPHRHTDAVIAQLRDKVQQIQTNADWIKSAPAAANELRVCFTNLRERVQAERALREVRPADSLRATIWGLGDEFPQLCARELIDTSSRYLAAQGRCALDLETQSESGLGISSAEQLREAQRTLAGIKDPELRKAMLAVLGDDVTDSFFSLAFSSSELLRDELWQLLVTEHKARDNNVIDETDGAEQAKAQGRPDTSEFERLEELRFAQKNAFDDAVHAKSKLDARKERYDKRHTQYPSLEEIREVETSLTRTRRALRETSKQINKEMTLLAEAGSDHWPEVLVRLPKVGEFKQMDFIRSGDLTMDSYENVAPLQGNSRNNVFTATLDGVEVVLKQYDLTRADEITAVMNEVTQLHKMRHPNIVEVNGVFDEIKRGKTNMYLQMPRYSDDVLKWLKDNPVPDAQQRRQILLGVLRGVARVHEFNFTHNDIKLENVLLDRRRGKLQAVLCDFEMLKEETTLAIDGTVTTVGGTVAYMAPERFNQGHRPTKASDMFSVGVLMLFCFAPHCIEHVCRNKEDERHIAPQTMLTQVRDNLPVAVRDGIKGLLDSTPASRPSARSFLGTTDGAGNHKDTYFTHAEMELPVYWDESPQGRDEQLIEVTDDVLQVLRHTVAPQTRADFGKGIDKHKYWMGIPEDHRDIEVVKAWRIQNEPLWKQYSAARERVADDVSRGPPIVSNDAPVCNRAKMMKPKSNPREVCPGCSAGGLRLEEAAKLGFVRREGQEPEDAGRFDVNETFLLHGIPKTALADVLLTGMDERYSGANKGTLFGAGSYFAQDIEKADQYNGEPVRPLFLSPTIRSLTLSIWLCRIKGTENRICWACTSGCTPTELKTTQAMCVLLLSKVERIHMYV